MVSTCSTVHVLLVLQCALQCVLECVLQGLLQRGAVCCKSGVAVFVAGCVAGVMQGVAQCVLQVVFQGGAVCVLLVLDCVLECVL